MIQLQHERRLGALEEKEKTNPDTAALERQRLQLDKVKSRLIDSYAEGMIDKTDFDPKIRRHNRPGAISAKIALSMVCDQPVKADIVKTALNVAL